MNFTPHSMRSPLATISMFRRTKAKDWAYNKRGAHYGAKFDTAPMVEISPVAKRVLKMKFNAKAGIYRFPNGLIFKKDQLEQAKIVARRLNYDVIKLGGVTIKL